MCIHVVLVAVRSSMTRACSRVSKHLARSTHISVTVSLSKCPSLPSGYKLRQAQTSLSLGWTFVQPRPSPRGNEAAAAAAFPLDLYGLRAL